MVDIGEGCGTRSQHLHDVLLKDHQISGAVPQDLGHERVFTHQFIDIDVPLLLEIFYELEMAGWDDCAHESAGAVVVTHLLLVLLEDSGDLCTD